MTLQKSERLAGIVSVVATLLLIPFIAMQFTEQVQWSPFDFAFMGSLMLGTGVVIVFLWRRVKQLEHRLAVAGIVLLLLFIIWAELAVGIFGSPFAGA